MFYVFALYNVLIYCAQVDGGNLPVGVIERRDFTLSLTDEETLRRPRLPFWHIDYFTQPQLDDPEFFLVPDWPLPEQLGPPVDVLGLPAESAAVEMRPARLCPSPLPENFVKSEEKLTSIVSLPQSSQQSAQSEQQSYDAREDEVASRSTVSYAPEEAPEEDEEVEALEDEVTPRPSGLSDVLK